MNRRIARLLSEVAALLERRAGNAFRVRAYRHAAERLIGLECPVEEIYREQGEAGIQTALDVGERMAGTVAHVILYGELPLLDRLRRAAGSSSLLESVPGVGRLLAGQLTRDLGIETLEDLEAAAYDGRLSHAGFGPKRIAGIRDSLASRLGRVRPAPAGQPQPPLADLLDIDREYREEAAAGTLRTIAPRRFNPKREAWLPVLRTRRGGRSYTALFSNTPRAHELGRTHDWVVIYEEDGPGRRPWTVITSHRGPFAGKRIVRGREVECAAHYSRIEGPPEASVPPGNPAIGPGIATLQV